MPRRQRKRWTGFVRKVKAVQMKQRPTQFLNVVRESQITNTINKQIPSASHTILGSNSNAANNHDIRDLFSRIVRVAGLEGNPSDLLPSRFIVSGWHAETTLTNMSEDDDDVYIDCYYWRSKRLLGTTVDTGTPVDTDVANVWEYANSLTGANFPGGGSALDYQDFGLTPFNNNLFAKYITIYKKTRIKLSAGQSTKISQRSGKNYFIDWAFAERWGMIPGKTEGIMFVTYGAPWTVQEGAISTSVPVAIVTAINYSYKVVPGSAFTGGTTEP